MCNGEGGHENISQRLFPPYIQVLEVVKCVQSLKLLSLREQRREHLNDGLNQST
jgi:hypothetical protein